MGKRRRPRPINYHASIEAAGFWGLRCSELDPSLRREGKPERTLGLGATVSVLETGVPRLACLRPTAWLSQQAVWPIFINKASKTLTRKTSRGSRDVSHDDRHQAGASARSVLVSSLVLRRPAQARSTEASGKGCLIGATRPRPGGRRDGGHRGAQDGLTTRAFRRRRPLLSG